MQKTIKSVQETSTVLVDLVLSYAAFAVLDTAIKSASKNEVISNSSANALNLASFAGVLSIAFAATIAYDFNGLEQEQNQNQSKKKIRKK